MEKYGKIIRKSYFPDLFFMQDGELLSPHKIYISVSIKFNLYKTLFRKTFPSSSHKEMHHENSGFFPKPKILGLRSTKNVHEKTISHYLEPGKSEPETLKYRLISPKSLSCNCSFPEPILYELISFNLTLVKLISNKIICNVHQSKFTSHEPIISKFIRQDHLSANYDSLNRRFLKINFLENNSRMAFSILINKIQILRRHEDFVFKTKDLFFLSSNLRAADENVVQKAGSTTKSMDLPSHPVLEAYNFFPNIRKELLRKIEELRLSSQEILFGGGILTIKPSIRIPGSGPFGVSLKLISISNDPERLEQEPKFRKIAIETVLKRRYLFLKQSKRKIWEKQDLIDSVSHASIYQRFSRAITKLRTGLFEKVLTSSIEVQAKSLQSVPKLKSSCNLKPKRPDRPITRMFDFLNMFPSSMAPDSQLYRQTIKKLVSLFFSPGFQAEIKSASRVLTQMFNIQGVLLACNKPTYAVGTYTIDSPANIIQETNHYFRRAWIQRTNDFTDARVSFIKLIVEDESYFKITQVIQKIQFLRAFTQIAACIPGQSVVQIPHLTVHIFNNLAALKYDLTKDNTLNYSTVNSTVIKDSYSYLLQIFRAPYYIGILPGSNHHKVEFKRELKKKKQCTVRRNKVKSKPEQLISLRFPESIVCKLKRTAAFLYSNKLNFTSNGTATLIHSLQETNILNLRQKLTFQTTSAHIGINQTIGVLNYSTNSTQNYPVFLIFSYKNVYPFKYSLSSKGNLSTGMINYLAIDNYIQEEALLSSTSVNHNPLEKRILREKGNCLPFYSLPFSSKRTGIYTTHSKKGVFKYYNFSDSLSWIIEPDVAKYYIASKTQEPVPRDRILSNGLFSSRYLETLIPSGSEIIGISSSQKATQLYEMSRFSALTVPLNPVFAGPYEPLSDAGNESLNAGSLGEKTATTSSHFIIRQKLNVQKSSYRKTKMIILNPGGRKEKYASSNYYCQKRSAKLIEFENSTRQMNSKIDNLYESQMIPRTPYDFIHLVKPYFTPGMMGKKVFLNTFILEKKTENLRNTLNRILLIFKALKSTELIEKHHTYPRQGRTSFAFHMAEEADKSIEATSFWTKWKNGFFNNVSWPQNSREELLRTKNSLEGIQDALNPVHLSKKSGLLSKINGISGKRFQDQKSIGFSEINALNEQKTIFPIEKSQHWQKYNMLAFNVIRDLNEENIVSHGTLSPLKNIDLQYAGSSEGDVIGSVEGNNIGKALIENIKNEPELTSNETIKFLLEKNSSYRVSPDEINTIIDKVYRRLETKILTEKERRGLR